jgi:hypothetical protein
MKLSDARNLAAGSVLLFVLDVAGIKEAGQILYLALGFGGLVLILGVITWPLQKLWPYEEAPPEDYLG